MGLDMYLTKRTYVKNWDFTPPEERVEITIKGGKGEGIKPERITYITEEVAYWRKANAIHNWFVKNVQEGKDDCGEYAVDTEQIKQLVDICEAVLAASKLVEGKVSTGYTVDANGRRETFEDGKVIENSSRAEELLPTVDGFFFGGTDYDQYYLEDLTNTVKMLKPLLSEPQHGSFHYRASW